jgi:gluconolactonase
MILVEGLKNPEGPVLLPSGDWALVEMHPDRGWVARISADGTEKRVLAKTGRPNGLALDAAGALWVAESVNPPSLLRLAPDGAAESILTGCGGEPFLFPNDLCFGPDGFLYMTDSGIPFPLWRTLGSEERKRATPDGRLYRIDPTRRTVEKLDAGLPFANGIAFGPDGSLYVSATVSGRVYRYRAERGRLGPREPFGDVVDPAGGDAFRGPDGMAFGQDGHLYVAVVWQGDVTVLDPAGRVARRIRLAGPGPTNVAFGPPGSRKLYVTEQGSGLFEVHDVPTDGLPLFL